MKPFHAAILGLIVIGLLTTIPRVRSWSDASRMATVQSLVERGTFIIEESDFIFTEDKVYIKGHFYSDKSPMSALLGAAVYWPLYHLGLRLDTGMNLTVWIIILLTVKLPWLLGVIAFGESLKHAGQSDRNRIYIMLSLGVASLFLPFSSAFNNNVQAAAMIAIGWFFLMRALHPSESGPARRGDLFGAGLFLSMAGVTDVPSAIFYVGFFALLLASPRARGRILYYLLPMAVTVLPTFWITWSISGSILPFDIHKEYFDYPGSPWLERGKLSGVAVNPLSFMMVYGPALLFGPKGFILYNPLLLLAIPRLVREMARRGPFWREAIVVAAGSVILIGYYVLYSSNFGGWSYGIRWFLPVLPPVYFFLHSCLETGHRRNRMIFATLFAAGVVIAGVGVINPWSNPGYSAAPFLANLIQLWNWLAG